jgi:hypothetical protein
VKTEVKKVEIAIKQAKMDEADFKMKKKIKYNIAGSLSFFFVFNYSFIILVGSL